MHYDSLPPSRGTIDPKEGALASNAAGCTLDAKGS
jgi:hypothetical protein